MGSENPRKSKSAISRKSNNDKNKSRSKNGFKKNQSKTRSNSNSAFSNNSNKTKDSNRNNNSVCPSSSNKKLISQQQQRVVQYRQHLEQQQALAQQNAVLLQQQKRIAQYRFQEQYLDRVRQQQIHLRDDRFDYARDPYFYTAPIYRYNRGGSYYETNEYGAKTLRQAVNYGYEEGFRAGKADRDDRWGSNYKDSYAYRDANYGYSGYYVDRSDYNYYFREGFRRGYEDGYNSRYQYGRFANGIYSILDTILSQILNFQALR
jgi:hypothetical protein